MVDAALSAKAVEPVLLHVTELVSYADYLLLLSGTSTRHVDGITAGVLKRAREQGTRPLAVEGRESCKWVLIDLGEIVVHVFLEEQRGYYDLDGLWIDAPRVALPEAEGREHTPSYAL